jgi:hypothetical protein
MRLFIETKRGLGVGVFVGRKGRLGTAHRAGLQSASASGETEGGDITAAPVSLRSVCRSNAELKSRKKKVELFEIHQKSN